MTTAMEENKKKRPTVKELKEEITRLKEELAMCHSHEDYYALSRGYEEAVKERDEYYNAWVSVLRENERLMSRGLWDRMFNK